jgi:hypothetical protein
MFFSDARHLFYGLISHGGEERKRNTNKNKEKVGTLLFFDASSTYSLPL